MKKILLWFCFLTSVTYAQENSIFSRKHEIKVGAVKLLAGPILEGTYEYVHSNDFTYGVSILGKLDNGNDYYEDFSVTPFARFYFQETKEFGAKGFFVEGFAKYSTGYYDYDSYDTDRKYSAGALGISLGKKWINRTGFIFEILVGAGRTIGSADYKPDFIFRGDLNLGYRF